MNYHCNCAKNNNLYFDKTISFNETNIKLLSFVSLCTHTKMLDITFTAYV